MTAMTREPVPLADYVPTADRFLTMRVTGWAAFEALLDLRGERHNPRLAYLDGVVQLMSPSVDHEQISRVIAQLLILYCVERKVPCSTYGSWTQKDESKKAGAEPDECFVFDEDPRSRSRPDLVIEVIWTSGSIDKLEIYRRLQIPEVWFWDNGGISIYVLGDDGYVDVDRSRFVPELEIGLLSKYLQIEPHTKAIADFVEALRSAK